MAHAEVCNHGEDVTVAQNGLRTHWVQLAMTDGALLGAVFLSACRSLAVLQATGGYFERALKYKGDCIRSVNSAISREGPSPSATTIATILALASDAVSSVDILECGRCTLTVLRAQFTTGDVTAAQKHCEAVDIMIKIKGGSRALGGNSFLRRLVAWTRPDPGATGETHPGQAICRQLEQSGSD